MTVVRDVVRFMCFVNFSAGLVHAFAGNLVATFTHAALLGIGVVALTLLDTDD